MFIRKLRHRQEDMPGVSVREKSSTMLCSSKIMDFRLNFLRHPHRSQVIRLNCILMPFGNLVSMVESSGAINEMGMDVMVRDCVWHANCVCV